MYKEEFDLAVIEGWRVKNRALLRRGSGHEGLLRPHFQQMPSF